MVSQTVTIINPTGLHMRPAGLFASTMGKFSSNVTINGKSPMAIMAGGLGAGTEIEIVCEGSDEADALKAAVELVESGLGE